MPQTKSQSKEDVKSPSSKSSLADKKTKKKSKESARTKGSTRNKESPKKKKSQSKKSSKSTKSGAVVRSPGQGTKLDVWKEKTNTLTDSDPSGKSLSKKLVRRQPAPPPPPPPPEPTNKSSSSSPSPDDTTAPNTTPSQATLFDDTQWENCKKSAWGTRSKSPGKKTHGKDSHSESSSSTGELKPVDDNIDIESIDGQPHYVPGEENQRTIDQREQLQKRPIKSIFIRTSILGLNILTFIFIMIPYGPRFTPNYGLGGMIGTIINLLLAFCLDFFLLMVLVMRWHVRNVSRGRQLRLNEKWREWMALLDQTCAVLLFFGGLLLIYYSTLEFKRFANTRAKQQLASFTIVTPIPFWAIGALLLLVNMTLHLFLIIRTKKGIYN